MTNLRHLATALAATALTLHAAPPEPAAVLATMEKVASWQLANPGKHKTWDWTQAALFTGIMAVDGVSPSPQYRAAMLAAGATNEWKPGPRLYHGDDHAVGMMYLELFEQLREPHLIAGIRAQFDQVIAAPDRRPLAGPLHAGKNKLEPMRWWWCDALFMGPPTLARLYAATGDTKYRDFLVQEWKATSDFLFDQEEHLYFRDSTYFPKREANGRKIFWSRGNGWVFAGLVRVLQYLPDTDPDRPFFVAQFKQMAGALLKCQQPDGLWRASLLDPASYPMQEVSGSGFYTYGLAWGVNEELLGADAADAAIRGWTAMAALVNPDGKLTHVQPIGADPKHFDEQHSDVFGVGSFLLAGSEVYRLGLFAQRKARAYAYVKNPAAFRRARETVELEWAPLQALLAGAAAADVAVLDSQDSRVLDTQVLDADGDGTPEHILFQTDLLPGESKRFAIVTGLPADRRPKPALTASGRFVPERKDDFAWENDRVAFRMYGPALQQTPGEVSGSGIDVWSKRVRYPVVDAWYKLGDYHKDHGEGLDNYKVGTSRGCGGTALWIDGRLVPSANFTTWKRIANGPVRVLFELAYAPWAHAEKGVTRSERKRISLDRGASFNRIESHFDIGGSAPYAIAAGLVKRKGEAAVTVDRAAGTIAYTEPEAGAHGRIHCGLIVPQGTPVETDDHHLLTRPGPAAGPFIHYAGAGWSRFEQPTHAAWAAEVAHAAARLAAPVEVTVRP